MERRKPACRGAAYGDQSKTVHAPHGYFPWQMSEPVECPGWTEMDAGTTVLADRLDQLARESLWPRALPLGARLECHPLVRHALRQLFISGFAEFVSSLNTGEDMLKPQIPLVARPVS